MYQMLFQNSNDAMFVLQPSDDGEPNNFIEVNDTACTRYGYSKEEFLQLSPREIEDPVYKHHIPGRIKKLLTDHHILFETIHLAKDGGRMPVEINSHLFHLDGTSTIISVVRDITERKKAEDALIKQREEIRIMAHRLSEAEETERHRIATELHDLAGQNLTSLSINLNLLNGLLPNESNAHISDRLKDCLSIVEQTSRCLRDVMADLRPPVLDDYGLPVALHWYGKQFYNRTGIEVNVKTDDLGFRFPVHVEISLFRIVQESLTNVLKHACVKDVSVTLKKDALTMVLMVVDKGVGFEDGSSGCIGRNGSWGFSIMRERAEAIDAGIHIISQVEKGTSVIVEKDISKSGQER